MFKPSLGFEQHHPKHSSHLSREAKKWIHLCCPLDWCWWQFQPLQITHWVSTINWTRISHFTVSIYNNFKWVQIGPISDEVQLQLSKLDPSKTDKKKILIDHGRVKETDIIVSPDLIEKLDGLLNALNIEYTIAHQDVSELIKRSGTFTNKKIYPLSTRARMRSEHKLELDQWNRHPNVL